jgi:hypothetical protein
MKRWFNIIARAIVALLLIVTVFPFARDTISHDLGLRHMAKSFSVIEHPDGSTHVETFTAVGLLAGNGNHCDYFVENCTASRDHKTTSVSGTLTSKSAVLRVISTISSCCSSRKVVKVAGFVTKACAQTRSVHRGA